MGSRKLTVIRSFICVGVSSPAPRVRIPWTIGDVESEPESGKENMRRSRRGVEASSGGVASMKW